MQERRFVSLVEVKFERNETEANKSLDDAAFTTICELLEIKQSMFRDCGYGNGVGRSADCFYW